MSTVNNGIPGVNMLICGWCRAARIAKEHRKFREHCWFKLASRDSGIYGKNQYSQTYLVSQKHPCLFLGSEGRR